MHVTDGADRADWILVALLSAHGSALTPVRLQKALFLLGARRRDAVKGGYYNFTAYHYGPFDSAIYHDAERLAANGLLNIGQSSSGLREYALTSEGAQAATDARRRLDSSGVTYLQDVVQWAERLEFHELVRAVYDAYPEMRANSIFREPDSL